MKDDTKCNSGVSVKLARVAIALMWVTRDQWDAPLSEAPSRARALFRPLPGASGSPRLALPCLLRLSSPVAASAVGHACRTPLQRQQVRSALPVPASQNFRNPFRRYLYFQFTADQ